MDLLSDLLQQAGLQRRLLDLSRLGDRAALRFPCNKSMGFHVVMQGSVFIRGEGLDEPLALKAGDMALMARGCDHIVSTSEDLPAGRIDFAGSGTPTTGDTSLISAAYQFWNEPLHPLFSQLPAWTVVRAESLPRLAPMSLTVALLGSEAAGPALGSDTVVHGLLDASFMLLLREIVERTGVDAQGWSRGLGTVPVRRAVELLHADSARAWTLDELARAAGLSRTGLAEKFRESMGDTPLNYLRMLRVQKAMRLLSATDAKLEQVAREVGYTDAFSFSKVFKKVVGVGPRDFRRRDAEERSAPYRF